MQRFFSSTAAVALALALAATLPAHGQDNKPKPMAASSARNDILKQIDDAEKKLIALAEAMPAEKFAWRPAEGIRSVGEVFTHVSGANYFLSSSWGAKAPAGVDPREFEKTAGDKAKTTDVLKKSFEHVRQAVNAMPDNDLDRSIKVFGRNGTVREALLLLATHAHEHLGQSIAYARMNGVAPPWSR